MEQQTAEVVSLFHGTFWALVPSVVAIVLALITKEAYSSLFVGIVIGGLFISQGSFPQFLDAVFKNGDLVIDYAAGCAYLAEQELKLTPIEYRLLCLLAQNVGKVLTHKYITQKIWGVGWENNIASLRVFMATLRKKLESSPDSPAYIQTHIGVGYRMLKL
jgi:two-component system KDP operon response regulator KdpE